ncbi:MAG TPA: acetoacetate decarboxylase family protein [Thermodesulfobacteriota bacterium]|nr:acetoacetate decarboxylase family protein [Thermodesulfobacteriota bacterium]
MGMQANEYSLPWLAEGEMPALPMDRDRIHIISQGVADPVFDYDIVPLTYTESRWMPFIIRCDQAAMQKVCPEPIKVQDDIVEFWYVIHRNTMLGPYMEMGVTFSATVSGEDGATYRGGYYPYMYLSNDSPIWAGREPFGFPKKAAYIAAFEHGTNNNYFNALMERRGYILHTANGRYSDKPLSARPTFYGKTDWGRLNYRITTRPDVTNSIHEVTYLPSELPPQFGTGHRFQLNPASIRTATGNDIRSWFLQGTPFDYMGGQIPSKEIIGLLTFTFNLIIPPAKTIWSKTVTRGDADMGQILYSTPYKYTMRHRFLLPQYSQA